MEEDAEEARDRYILNVSLKILWTSLTLLAASGVLVFLTISFGWFEFVLLCLLGLLAGIAIAIGVLTSLQNRVWITFVFGALTLPSLAVYLAAVSVKNQAAFNIYSAVLIPFVAYTVGAIISGLVIAAIWAKRPEKMKSEEELDEIATGPSQEVPAQMAEGELAEHALRAEEETKAEEGVQTT